MYPQYILQKGYLLAYKEDKVVSSVNNVEIGDLIHLHFKDGKIKSKVIEK